MEFKCNICNRDFETEESLRQHNEMKHFEVKIKAPINKRKLIISGILILIIMFSILSVYSYISKPGGYDEFAKCLTEKGAVIYGNDYCQYTAKQLGMFGKSKKNLNYIKCIDNEKICDEKGVKITPTWWIGENKLDGVQSFEKLSTLSGCKI